MPDEGDFQVETSTRDGATVVSPVGDVDLSRSPQLRSAIQDAYRSKPSRLIVDLASVDYMDSSGVATLVEALQMSRQHGATLVLSGMKPRVRSIFEIARLDHVFTIVDDVGQAVEG